MAPDDQGRIVRRPAPPGRAGDDALPEAFRSDEPNEHDFDSDSARGASRLGGLPRGVGLLVVIALLLPLLLGVFSVVWQGAFGE